MSKGFVRIVALLSVAISVSAQVTTETVNATGVVARWFVADEWTKLGGTYAGAEGAQWIEEDGEPTFVYAAHHDFLALKWSASKGLVKWRTDSPEATSFRPDGKGGYYVVEQTTRRVTRWDEDAKMIEVLATRYQGKRLNRPNDLRVHSDGALWFTDPAFMYGPKFPGQVRELDDESVYRLDPATKALSVVATLGKPNGIAFSPDEKWLYLTDSRESHILRFPVDGKTLDEPEVFVDLKFKGLDGLAFDPAGNLWCGTRQGAYVFSPQAQLLGTVTFADRVSSFAFKKLDNGQVYLGLTTRTAAYVAKLNQER